MLWIYLCLPQLPLDVLLEGGTPEPCAVFQGQGSRQQLICVNAAARALQIPLGHAPSSVQALVAELQCFPRNPNAEQAALQALAAWAGQFTDRVYLDTDSQTRQALPPCQGLLLEVSRCLNYHGGLSSLLGKIQGAATALNYTLHIGVAPTAEGAILLAQHAQPSIARSVPELLQQIRDWPLSQLRLPRAITEKLERVGVTRIAQLLQLPADQLARRYGTGLIAELRCLQGLQQQPRPRYTAPAHYQRRHELMAETSQIEYLRPVLRRMLFELQGYLVQGDRSVRQMLLRLEHPGDLPSTEFLMHLMQGTRDAIHLQGLLQERMDRHPLCAPVIALELQVKQFDSAQTHQADLFDSGPNTLQNWLSLLERLQARLGPSAVLHPIIHADHRPEHASGYSDQVQAADRHEHPSSPRPFWLLPTPKELAQPPLQRSGVERIESGWWDGAPATRDYYIARTLHGGRLWVYQERGRWYLHGIWA